MKIRPVTLADAAALLEIYAPYVETTMISFETRVPSENEMARRVQEIGSKFPWFVLESGEKVVAYAYAGTFKARAAYDWTVETAIYVHQDFHGQGFGEKLYLALLNELRVRKIANAVAVISLPNERSVLFHERLGFKAAGRLASVGFKFEQWWDIGYWQLRL